MQWFTPTANQATAVAGFESSARKSGTYDLFRMVGLWGNAVLQGSGTVTGMMGVKGSVSLFGADGEGGTVSNSYAFWAESPTKNPANSQSITNNSGLYISNQGDSFITNSYGIYLQNQTGSTTNNYSIYSAGGLNYLAGSLGVGISPSSSANLVLAAPTTSVASLRLTASSAVDPSSPSIGDLWFNGTNLYFRKDGSTSQDLLAGAGCPTCIYQAPTTTAQNTIQPATSAVIGLTVNGTNTGTAAQALVVNQAYAADGINLNLTNTSGTQTSGLQLTRNGAGGTTTSILGITNTAGTATNGILFTGTIGTDIATASGRALTITANAASTWSTTAGNLTLQAGSGTIVSGSHILPSTDDTYDLGSSSYRWRDLYLGPTSLHVSSTTTETTTASDWKFGIQEADGTTEGNFKIMEGSSEY